MANTLITKEYLDSVIANLVSFIRTEDEIRYRYKDYTITSSDLCTITTQNVHTCGSVARVYVEFTHSLSTSIAGTILRGLPAPIGLTPVTLCGIRTTSGVRSYQSDVRCVIDTSGNLLANFESIPAGDYILNITYQIEEE